jgi:hypothetical protein
MVNSVLNPSVIAKEALMQLENNLVMGNLVHRDYKKEFAKVGDSVTIRRPVQFVASDGAARVNQDVTEGSTSITIGSRKHVSWGFSSQDLTLTIEEYSKRYINPAMITLANAVDADLTGLYSDVYNFVGTPGTVPSTFAELGAAGQRLDEGAVPRGDRNGVFNPATAWKLADGLKGVFVQDKARGAFEEAKIGRYAALDTYMDQNVKVHTTGAYGGTSLIAGASQSVTYASVKSTMLQTITTDGWTASVTGVLKKGDVITLAGVFAVNPVSKQSTGSLQNFVVTADATSDSGGLASLVISPPIIITGAYQTVTAAPADNAAITVKTGTASTGYAQNLTFHKNAFGLVMIPIEMPDGAAFKAREQYNGLSARVIKDYDIDADTDVIRIDILYGVKTLDPRLAARLTS